MHVYEPLQYLKEKSTFLHLFGTFSMISKSQVHGPHKLQNIFFFRTHQRHMLMFPNSFSQIQNEVFQIS